MDLMLDAVMNLSPILFGLLYIIHARTFNSRKRIKCFINSCSCYILGGFLGIFPQLIVKGYGKIYIVVVVQVALMFGYIFLFFWIAKNKQKKTDLLLGIFVVMYIFATIYACYYRIQSEYAINIWFMDELLYNMYGVYAIAFPRIIYNVVNNEWFKGISIGVISAVIAGLLLERIKKNK